MTDLAPSAIAPVSFDRYDSDFEGFSKDLGDSFRRYGFAVVSDHGMGQEKIESAIDKAKQFFALPEDVKRQVEAQLGLQPSQLPSPEQMQAVLAQQMVQAGEAIQQGAVQKAVQEVGQGLEPVLAAIQQQQTQLSQLAQALAQNRDQDAQVAAGVGELQQALAGLAQQHQQLQGLLADQASQATGPGVPSL